MRDAPLYPVTLVLEGKPCLVVGGGRVASRKVRGLLHCGAVVTVVSPEVSAEIADMEQQPPGSFAHGGSIRVQRRTYLPGEAARYRLVVAATGDRELNRRVFREAEAAGVFVNSADDPDSCSFMLPSVIRHDPVTVAVSTGGSSPALAVWIRNLLSGFVGPSDARLAGILSDARLSLQREGRSSEELDWEVLLEGELPQLVQEGRITEARRLVTKWVGAAGVKL